MRFWSVGSAVRSHALITIIIAGSTLLMTSIIHSILVMQVAGQRLYLNSHPWSILRTGYVPSSSENRRRKPKDVVRSIGVKQQALPMVVLSITSPLRCLPLHSIWIVIFPSIKAIQILQRAEMNVDIFQHHQHIPSPIGALKLNATSNT